MKKSLILAFLAMLAVPAGLLSQEPPANTKPQSKSEPLEAPDEKNPPPGDREKDRPDEPSKAEQWRSEVLAWKNVRRVEEGTESGSIKELSRAVLVLGKVNGDVSTVSGDVAVLGDVNGNVSSVSGTVTVLGTINGKASVVGGNLRVAGKVTGDASVVGGSLETAPGGQVLGNSNSIGKGHFKFNFGSGDFRFNVHERNREDSGLVGVIKGFWLSPFMLLWRTALLILWVALSCAIAALFQPNILRAQSELRNAPARSIAFGFLWTILFWMLLVACLILSLMLIGVPLLIVLIAFDLALTAFGMTLVFSLVGEWIARQLNHPNASLYAAVFAGACFLGLLRLVPIAGSVIWFAAGLFGIGATLAARFGMETNVPPRPASLPPITTV